jgi:hypothetical protein
MKRRTRIERKVAQQLFCHQIGGVLQSCSRRSLDVFGCAAVEAADLTTEQSGVAVSIDVYTCLRAGFLDSPRDFLAF